MNKRAFLVMLLCSFYCLAIGQNTVLDYGRTITKTLCDTPFYGRGYVKNGVGQAAEFLTNEFKRLKLKPVGKDYLQTYQMPVNIQDLNIQCSLDDEAFYIGRHFLVDAASPAVNNEFYLRHFNAKDSTDLALLALKLDHGFQSNEALVLHHSSKRSLLRHDSLGILSHALPLIIFTEDKKLTHTVSTSVDEIPSLVFFDSLIANKERLRIICSNKFEQQFKCNNVVGFLPGKRKDSFLVFTAHYDHLGKQGQAMFPGASDNASGVSMVLNLASYFAQHKPKYPTYFILFSGEEAGLVGSTYFTENPLFNLNKIKLLINLDIMGNAENGVTVVNGEQQRTYFEALKKINEQNQFLPEVRIRGKAANSDHYPFAEKGVPAIFIYSLGGQGYYHDIDDTYEHLGFKNYEAVYKLLLTFTQQL